MKLPVLETSHQSDERTPSSSSTKGGNRRPQPKPPASAGGFAFSRQLKSRPPAEIPRIRFMLNHESIWAKSFSIRPRWTGAALWRGANNSGTQPQSCLALPPGRVVAMEASAAHQRSRLALSSSQRTLQNGPRNGEAPPNQAACFPSKKEHPGMRPGTPKGAKARMREARIAHHHFRIGKRLQPAGGLLAKNSGVLYFEAGFGKASWAGSMSLAGFHPACR
ncbi:MAG: hypothetical protein OXF66_10250, partial [Gammaproteobacteria bacterium]|nr:hypothetical protein [Gammaproteobacteria bacterium]